MWFPQINTSEGNYVLGEIINSNKSNVQNEALQKYTQNPEFIFLNIL